MSTGVIAFTAAGMALAKRIASFLGEEAVRGGKEGMPLSDFARKGFEEKDALVFVGAVGIAVRAISPYVVSKTSDPAVVVIDEKGSFVIPILSGHLGGANALAVKIAEYLKAVPVITTATDVNGVFAVDTWAKSQGCAVGKAALIKHVSSSLLESRTVFYSSDCEIAGIAPAHVEKAPEGTRPLFSVSVRKQPEDVLPLIPKIGCLGIGCKKDTPAEAIEDLFRSVFSENGIYPQCVAEVCSIDLKAQEPGILNFCRAHALPFRTFPASQLLEAKGTFSASEFVKGITGVDNVCERSAVIGAGNRPDSLILKKTAANGVTMALALRSFAPEWKD